MNRSNVAEDMIQYLENTINCDNILTVVDSHIYINNIDPQNEHDKKLLIKKNLVSFEYQKYNDTPGYIYEKQNDVKNRTDIEKQIKVLDFMTESNYTGFEYFPYIYGVLQCHNNKDSVFYMFYESFDGFLDDLISKIEHASEWYDIIFQLIVINYYVNFMSGYTYQNIGMDKFLYRKLQKPIYKQYDMENIIFNVNHKYLIVVWNLGDIQKISTSSNHDEFFDLNFLKQYLSKNPPKINPSPRILELISKINNNPKNALNILKEYYVDQK